VKGIIQNGGVFIQYQIVKVIHFCYGHRLLNYEGKCRNLHGHNGKVEIELESDELDPRGMVADFGDVNRIVKEWIDRELDHKMILCKDDPVLEMMGQYEQPVFLLNVNPTAENLAHLIFDFVKSQGFPVSKVRLWETPSSFAAYQEMHSRGEG
jgi:6-pyruvoyltetrahydropterin/6-carboxytetrahydropterin synthase